jgi:hypothetical protein
MSLRTDIIDIMKSPHCRRINFQTETIRISGVDYSTIARCIENRHIQVVQSGSLPSTKAVYKRTFNCFIVGSSPSRNLVVHEGTHAINDWHKRNILDVEDEVSAYIAQMVFLFVENPELRTAAQQPRVRQSTNQFLQQCRIDSQYCNTAAIGEASAIAIDILAGRRINADTLRGLRQALARDPDTHTDPQNPRRSYNGVLRTTIPADFLREIQGTVIDN